MDPICHTLVGAALAQTRLRSRTSMAGAALVIGANIPDVDVVAYFWGETAALEFRRGWTHGVLALVVWPFVLTGLLVLWHRWRGTPPRGGDLECRPGALLGLSVLAVLTHPALDTLNVYGVRWLMPFSPTWFYGDVLFIVDPWLWLILGIGTLLASWWRRRGSATAPWSANLALAISAGYILAMGILGRVARAEADRAYAAGGHPGRVLLAAPEPLNPFRRGLVGEDAAGLRPGEYDLRTGRARWASASFPPLATIDDPRVRRAAEDPEAANFLTWARFPTAQIRDGGTGPVWVDFLDLRYATAPGTFGAHTVGLERRSPTHSEP